MKLRGGEFSTGTRGNFQPELTFQQFWHIKASAVTGHCAINYGLPDVLVMFGSCRINPSWLENVQRIGCFRRRIETGFFTAARGRVLGDGHTSTDGENLCRNPERCDRVNLRVEGTPR